MAFAHCLHNCTRTVATPNEETCVDWPIAKPGFDARIQRMAEQPADPGSLVADRRYAPACDVVLAGQARFAGTLLL